MRLKGKLAQWNEQKAYGFITPTTGDKQIFIHKNAFANRSRAPKAGDIVTFTLSQDNQDRPCAANAVFAGEAVRQSKTKTSGKKPGKGSVYLALTWLVVLAAIGILGLLPVKLVVALLGLNVFTFVAYAWDKLKAQRGAWRTPESTLHLLALAGGWPGAAIAQQLLRHKSKKQSFRAVYWGTVICNITAVMWLLSGQGQQALAAFGA
ncbi:cold shock and DUF1294 domain-containing protein [Neiella marina]|uniref:Cold shock and DUF1294 domain-containing protein n=1 Tax=Neiella holothuriorum TaxID=2870530 RepID=A0ABS7EGG6_9GAMM|nr:cold shock and DUF1294 domain-containing protein [Neiella holothuriorum]MBW8191433.1 cold shock and DUF1294 domain-containing protein [Neiella holothuriorum]